MKGLKIAVAIIAVLAFGVVLFTNFIDASEPTTNKRVFPSQSPASEAQTNQSANTTINTTPLASSEIVKQEPEYDKLIPKFEYGTMLMAVVDQEDSNKVYAYTDVTYNDVKQYKELLIEFGYKVNKSNYNENEDKATIILFNKKDSATLQVTYSKNTVSLKLSVD